MKPILLHPNDRVLAEPIQAGQAFEIFDLILAVAANQRTVSEALGHQEFILTYKAFDPIGPACLPLRRAS
jgi:hypothetical protein